MRALNDPDARTVVARDLLSKYEMNFWYGLSEDPPQLLWRSDVETNPFPVPPPRTDFSKIPTKTIHGVSNRAYKDAWGTVAAQIMTSMKAHGLKYSALMTTRFSIAEDGKDEALGPIVVSITVPPDTTNAEGVRAGTPDTIHILDDAQLTGVVVEWHEGVVEVL